MLLHQHLALHAVATSKLSRVYRLLGLADMSRRLAMQANGADDFVGYAAWDRLLTVYLRRLLGAALANEVKWVVYETGEPPTYVIRRMSKESA